MNIDRAAEAGIVVNPPSTNPIPVEQSLTSKVAEAIASSTPEGEAMLQAETNPGAPGIASDAWVGAAQTPIETRWILTRLSETSASVANSLNDYRFDEAANSIYQFFWGDFCDWYLELVKLRLNFGTPPTSDPVILSGGPERAAGESNGPQSKDPEAASPISTTKELSAADREATALTLNSLITVFDASLRLLSPFMPFITEEIWHALYNGAPPAKSIALSRYPQPIDFPADPIAESAMKTMQELIITIRALRKELGVPEKESTPIHLHASNRVNALADANQDMLARMARVASVELASEPLSGSNARSTADFDVAVIYERQIDIPAERERLTKDLAKYEKGLTAAERQLGNEAFMAKAPAHIVEGLRKQSTETRMLYDKTKAALDALGES